MADTHAPATEKSRIVVVNERDEVIGYKEQNALGWGDYYRIATLGLLDREGRMMLAKRPLSKKIDPGKWCPAVNGTIEEGEDYDDNIVKEIEEEIGLRISLPELRKGPKLKLSNLFVQWYFLVIDTSTVSLTLDANEIIETKWVFSYELRTWFEERPDDFVPSAPLWLPEIITLSEKM